ncbi:rhamnogalacturonan acetylesterase [Flavitalea sp.]|nr:rhamnogalacturonan acetylesterase [Flavitalea sp.]
MKLFYILFLALPLMSVEPKKIRVWLIGDSTCANKEIRAYPETGWGMPFTYFFDSTVQVRNMAVNGRSTKSFIAEKRWQHVLDSLQEGDYVFIQFGHNDEVKEKVDRYTTPEEFGINLKRYVDETRSKKGIPVLLTPVARRTFDSVTAKLKESHPIYSDVVRKVASDNKVPLIDLDSKSMNLLQQFGPEISKLLFLQLAPGEHPNYPEGKVDNTHFNELGARLIAQLVLGELRQQNIDLTKRTIKK